MNELSTNNTGLLSSYDPHDPNARFIAVPPQTEEDASAIFTAMNNPTHRMNEAINKTISLKNVYIQSIEAKDDVTGEPKLLPRTVLIDANGESYVSSSTGIFNALEKLFFVFGPMSTWKEPKDIVVKQVPVRRGTLLTLELA